MKIIPSAAIILFVILLGNLHAMPLNRGTLDSFDYERKVVTIKLQNFSLNDEPEIFRESEPEVPLGIKDLQRGHRVEYYFTNKKIGLPIIGTLIIFE